MRGAGGEYGYGICGAAAGKKSGDNYKPHIRYMMREAKTTGPQEPLRKQCKRARSIELIEVK